MKETILNKNEVKHLIEKNKILNTVYLLNKTGFKTKLIKFFKLLTFKGNY